MKRLLYYCLIVIGFFFLWIILGCIFVLIFGAYPNFGYALGRFLVQPYVILLAIGLIMLCRKKLNRSIYKNASSSQPPVWNTIAYWVLCIGLAWGVWIIGGKLFAHSTQESFEHCEQQDNSQLGHFVFMDDEGVCHASSDCSRLRNGLDEYGNSIYAMHPCDTAEFVFGASERVCSNCMSVSQFEQLKAISLRNMPYKVYRRWLYNTLQLNRDVGTYEEFVVSLSVPHLRRWYYRKAVGCHLQVGSFDDFSEDLGFNNYD